MDRGATYVVLGPVVGTVELALSYATVLGQSFDDLSGSALDGGADLDGDGYADLLVGASLNDSTGADAGAAYAVRRGPGL